MRKTVEGKEGKIPPELMKSINEGAERIRRMLETRVLNEDIRGTTPSSQKATRQAEEVTTTPQDQIKTRQVSNLAKALADTVPASKREDKEGKGEERSREAERGRKEEGERGAGVKGTGEAREGKKALHETRRETNIIVPTNSIWKKAWNTAKAAINGAALGWVGYIYYKATEVITEAQRGVGATVAAGVTVAIGTLALFLTAWTYGYALWRRKFRRALNELAEDGLKERRGKEKNILQKAVQKARYGLAKINKRIINFTLRNYESKPTPQTLSHSWFALLRKNPENMLGLLVVSGIIYGKEAPRVLRDIAGVVEYAMQQAPEIWQRITESIGGLL